MTDDDIATAITGLSAALGVLAAALADSGGPSRDQLADLMDECAERDANPVVLAIAEQLRAGSGPALRVIDGGRE